MKLNNKINIKEPFKNLFTQGMVCHETYKDQKGNWFYPEDIEKGDGNKYFKKLINLPLQLVHQSSCQNLKKILLIQKK